MFPRFSAIGISDCLVLGPTAIAKAETNTGCRLLFSLVATVWAITASQAALGVNVDAGVPGIAINRGILGATYHLQRPWIQGTPDRTYITGPASGLTADMFNWQTRVGTWDWTTLDTLRYIRDHDSTPVFLANVRGTGVSNGYNTAAGFHYTNKDLSMLTTLASEWVRYTNFILPNNGPLNPGDQAILDKIQINNGYDARLPNPGEAPVPKVQHWFIGNEPSEWIDSFYFTDNPLELPPFQANTRPFSEYVDRYKAISNAMKAVDPTIKVGPSLIRDVNYGGEQLVQSDATIDIWGYHPYDDLGDDFVVNGTPSQIDAMEAQLRGVRVHQIDNYNNQRQIFIDAGRNPDNVEFMANEWNPLNWSYGGPPSMYQALAFAESIFTFAELGLTSANYWGESAHPLPETKLYPMTQLWQKLNERMGDSLVNSIIDDANNRRVYTTRDNETGEIVVWGLNFDNDANTTINLSLQGLYAANTASYSLLNYGSGTRLDTADARWASKTVNDFDAGNYNLDIPKASIVMLKFLSLSPESVGDFNDDGAVDAADYVVWRKTIGTQDKYNAWRANFGRTIAGGSGAGAGLAAVPEPATSISLLLLGLIGFTRRLKRVSHASSASIPA